MKRSRTFDANVCGALQKERFVGGDLVEDDLLDACLAAPAQFRERQHPREQAQEVEGGDDLLSPMRQMRGRPSSALRTVAKSSFSLRGGWIKLVRRRGSAEGSKARGRAGTCRSLGRSRSWGTRRTDRQQRQKAQREGTEKAQRRSPTELIAARTQPAAPAGGPAAPAVS